MDRSIERRKRGKKILKEGSYRNRIYSLPSIKFSMSIAVKGLALTASVGLGHSIALRVEYNSIEISHVYNVLYNSFFLSKVVLATSMASLV